MAKKRPLLTAVSLNNGREGAEAAPVVRARAGGLYSTTKLRCKSFFAFCCQMMRCGDVQKRKMNGEFARQFAAKSENSRTMPSRFGATIEQMREDLTEGIDGKNLVTDTIRAFRNIIIAGWHGAQGAIPSVANAFNGQQYTVEERRGAFDGTAASAKKVLQTKGIVGKASAIFFELTDGPVDDLLALTGGAKRIVVPTRNAVQSTLAA